MGMTLGGPKPLALSSSPSSSYHPATTALTSRFTETTKGWSKDGGKGVAETSRQILSSGAFTTSLKLGNTPYTPDMSPVNKTQPTEVFTLPGLFRMESVWNPWNPSGIPYGIHGMNVG